MNNLTIPEPDNAMALTGYFGRMGYHHYGHSTDIEVLKNFHYFLSCARIQSACGFIGQQ